MVHEYTWYPPAVQSKRYEHVLPICVNVTVPFGTITVGVGHVSPPEIASHVKLFAQLLTFVAVHAFVPVAPVQVYVCGFVFVSGTAYPLSQPVRVYVQVLFPVARVTVPCVIVGLSGHVNVELDLQIVVAAAAYCANKELHPDSDVHVFVPQSPVEELHV